MLSFPFNSTFKSSFLADNGNLHRSSTMPGVIKDTEITTETTGPSNLERSKTERRKQSNPADDPAKQLLDDKISIRKKVCIPGPLIFLGMMKCSFFLTRSMCWLWKCRRY